MFNEKKFKELKKDMYLQASERWKKRKDIRRDPESLRKTDIKEFKLAEERLQNYIDREETRSRKTVAGEKRIVLNERIIRENDLRFFPPTDQAKEAGLSVARIEMLPKPGIQSEGFASGFLIAPNLLLTNHHVFAVKEDAKGCAARFMYERTRAGLQQGYSFELKPDEFFMSDEKLDFAIVYISSTSVEGTITLRNFKPLRLIETKGKIIKGDPISIIQYAGGGPKQYAYTDNQVLDILEEEGFVQYSTDTLPGSSGSPCYNPYWEVAALHHSGVPFVVDGKIRTASGAEWDGESEDDIQWVANEGISISTIINFLRTKKGETATAQELLKALIASTKDPLYEAPEKSTLPAPVTFSATGADPLAKKNIISSLKTNDMSNIQFNFYGQTSIYLNSQNAAEETVKQKMPTGTAISIVEKKQNFDLDYAKRKGYQDNFLTGIKIDLPSVSAQRENELYMDYHSNKPYILDYYHYSLVMNKKRRFCMWTASNVDYNEGAKSAKNRKEFGGEDWKLDPRIPAKYQLQDAEFYKPATNIDRGHIVRREDNCWGDSELEIEYANADTYHWTNCTPQHERFNQYRAEGYQGLWGKLETAVQDQLNIVDNKAILFAGPVLRTNDDAEDFGLGSIQYPNLYWKIILVNEAEQGLVAYGFVLDQTNVVNKFGLVEEEALLDFQQFKAQQVTIQKITEMTDVIFDKKVYAADVLKSNTTLTDGAIGFNHENMLYLKPKKAAAVSNNKPKLIKQSM